MKIFFNPPQCAFITLKLGNFDGQTLSGWPASTIIFVTPRNWNHNFLYHLLLIGMIILLLMIVLAVIFCFWYKRKLCQKQNPKIESPNDNAISNIDENSKGEAFSKNSFKQIFDFLVNFFLETSDWLTQMISQSKASLIQ